MQPPTPPIAAAPIAPRPVTQTPVKSPPPVAPSDRPAPPTPLGQDLETPRPAPQPTAVAAPTAPGADVLLRALFEGAGLPQLKLTEEQLPEVAANLGAILRETGQGLMEIPVSYTHLDGYKRQVRGWKVRGG